MRVATTAAEAIDSASFVLNSVRIGGIETRAHDERASNACGYPGQETTGPGGVAMGQRTIPVAIEQARMVERIAPRAWLVNFTNPAGLITQAMTDHSGARWSASAIHQRKCCTASPRPCQLRNTRWSVTTLA